MTAAGDAFGATISNRVGETGAVGTRRKGASVHHQSHVAGMEEISRSMRALSIMSVLLLNYFVATKMRVSRLVVILPSARVGLSKHILWVALQDAPNCITNADAMLNLRPNISHPVTPCPNSK